MRRIGRVCAHSGCNVRAEAGRDRCREHGGRARASARDRGYDAAWERARLRYLFENPWCERCGATATDVNHKDGKGPDGPRGFDWSNLESLCHEHHSSVTARSTSTGGGLTWAR